MNIGSFSTGRLSAIMSEKLFISFNVKDIDLVFMDTTIEDDDNYRFMNELKNRWKKLYNFKGFTVLKDGRNPYDVSHVEHVIPNSRVAPCTRRLKIEPFTKYLKETYSDNEITIHIGYDFSEVHRCDNTKKAYAEHGWNVDFPMLWKPIELRNYNTILREWNIEPPRMYEYGFSHANCGGRCVKQGIGDWIKTLINFPDRFAEAENWEREMRKNPVNAEYTILKRTVDKQIVKITLEDLRKEYESSKVLPMFQDVSCIHCGVGDFVS